MALRWRKGGKKLRVEMAGNTLATFESCNELDSGTQLAIGRDMWMGLRWIPSAEHFKVDLNGVAVRGASEVHPDTSDVSSMVLRIGIVNVLIGILAVAMFGPLAADTLVIGALFIILGLFVGSGFRAALGIAIGLLALALVGKVAVMVIFGAQLVSIVALVIYCACLLAMIRSYITAGSDW